MKLTLTLATGILLGSVIAASAGLFDSIATSGWPDALWSNAFKVDAFGSDIRVYQFRSIDEPDVLCTMGFGQALGGGISCVIKPQ